MDRGPDTFTPLVFGVAPSAVVPGGKARKGPEDGGANAAPRGLLKWHHPIGFGPFSDNFGFAAGSDTFQSMVAGLSTMSTPARTVRERLERCTGAREFPEISLRRRYVDTDCDLFCEGVLTPRMPFGMEAIHEHKSGSFCWCIRRCILRPSSALAIIDAVVVAQSGRGSRQADQGQQWRLSDGVMTKA